MKKPLLSIAIATRDRERYCIAAIQSILDFNDQRIEIAIADNSKSTLVKEFIENLSSNQVKYIYDNGDVSSIENFNRAANLTTGEYFMLIGDDDAILPKAIEIAYWAKENHVDSICSKNTVAYYWPHSRDIYPEGYLIVPERSNNLKQVDLEKNVIDLLKNGLQHYLLYPLPKTYHGIVRREVLEKIKATTGHIYGGLSPDIYSCLAVACVAKNHYLIDEPLSIAGVCATSTTADNFTGKHSGALENMPHLKNRGNYIWDANVPRFYSVNTIWAESGLKALQEIGRQGLVDNYFNPYKTIAQAYVNNRKFIGAFMADQIAAYKELHQISGAKLYSKLAWNTTSIIFKKLNSIVFKAHNKPKEFNNIPDIHQAILHTTSCYKEN